MHATASDQTLPDQKEVEMHFPTITSSSPVRYDRNEQCRKAHKAEEIEYYLQNELCK